MKQYLIETFRYNDSANRKALEKIKQLKDTEPCIKLFSHMVNSMNKWMSRILQDPKAAEQSWWGPVYPLENLERLWDESLQKWLSYLENKSEFEIEQELTFTGYDGSTFAAKLRDIALQLNYHSIHHRAQIQMMIRSQGIEPEFVDYIGTVYRRVPGKSST